jgi:hypothetical protein
METNTKMPQNDQPTSIMPEPDIEAQKNQLAYQFWEEDGRPEGKAEEHWNRACLVLMSMNDIEETAPEWLRRAPQNEDVAAQTIETAPEAKVADNSIEGIRRRLIARSVA